MLLGVDHLLTIGAFARRCGLSRSALRFYDECGLVRPVAVDDGTGYRYYTAAQVPAAILVRRLRAADMPVGEVRRFLSADVDERKEMLLAHTNRVEERTGALRRALEELSEQLDGRVPDKRACSCELSPVELAAGLKQVLFAAARDGQRPELSGVWVEARQGSLRLVATDSYRLAVRDLMLEDEADWAQLRGFVPLRRAEDLLTMLRGTGPAALRQQPDHTLEAVVDGVSVSIGERGDHFPDYEAVLLGNPRGHRALTGRHGLAEALMGAGARASVHFGPGALVVRSEGRETSVEASWDGPALSMTLNPGFITEALEVMVGPDVVVEAGDALLPVTLRSADTGTLTVLTMPIRPAT